MELQNFSEHDMEAIVEKLFSKEANFNSIESAYQELAKMMCESFMNETTKKSDLVLSRVYHSFDFQLLPASLKSVAKAVWKDDAAENCKFITLMGTYGDNPKWQDRTLSEGHKTILLSHDSLKKIPMVSRLLQQIGFDVGALLGDKNAEFQYEGISGTFGVFYVPSALNSPYIPAQDFVKEYNVQSVIGTGVMLPNGDISVYIGFGRIPISNEIAANISPLMSLFWQHAFTLLEERGMFSSL